MEARHALELRAIRKAFPGVLAVDDVSLEVHAGEIHGLVGENGAGKSTLANIAFGTLRPDAGSVVAAGTVGLVHQHFELAGRLTVWENVLLGREPRKGWLLDVTAGRERVRRLAESNGLAIDPDAVVEELPVAVQQRVELLRELERNPAVLLLDEPTAALAPAEIDTLFKALRDLAQRGTAILIITHKLQEVVTYCARVTVMRHGRVVAQYQGAGARTEEIARAMIGGDLPPIAQRRATVPQPCVRIEDLTVNANAGSVRNLTFEVRVGEIVGIAGVEGNGQTALADAIAGAAWYTGRISIERADGNRRIGIIPQDRLREGLVPAWSILDNVILGRQHSARVRRGVQLNRTSAYEDARAVTRQFDVRAPSLQTPVAALSGGNQQKIVVGRALLDEPAFVLAYQPTRGIDVGAAALVHSRLIEARNAGSAILLISFDLDEILALADRIFVMYRGRIVDEESGAAADRDRIARAFTGGNAV
ncbi:MAG TPA: ABC transporter ATP-binding protein [Candidatus Baltobacteraceae bacterium]|nr:ABC transporter ATP-binding protein [Candidatus Baltobacteraceae bacterium]